MDDYQFRALLERAQYATSQDVENRFLEMWKFSGENEPLIREGPLPDEELDDFLDAKGDHAVPSPPDGCELLGGHRLIIQTYAEEWTSGLWYPLPFRNEEVILKVFNKLQLPREIAIAWDSVIGRCWSRRQVNDCDEHLHIVLLDEWSTNFWLSAISYNARTRVTSGIVGGRVSRSQKGIPWALLRESADVAHHPLMTPVFAYASLLQDFVDFIIRPVRQDLMIVDRKLGLNEYPGELGEHPEPPRSNNYRTLNQMLVTVHELLSARNLVLLQHISTTIRKAILIFESINKLPAMEATSEATKDRLGFLNQNLDYMVSLTKEYKARITVDSSALYNLMAQRDNKLNISVAADSRRIASASKRDSSAMKTIAVLTILFLPGTFVSAIFSTTIFDFRSSDKPTMSKNFWIYWAVTIPLTIAVVGIWTAWYYWNDRKHAKQDKDLEESMARPNSIGSDDENLDSDQTPNNSEVPGGGEETDGENAGTNTHARRKRVQLQLRRMGLSRPDFVKRRSRDWSH